jgi:3-oxoacyl-(acyl-carrier-protein) synthase
MKRRRVKITGIGFVTPAGIGRDAFSAGILSGKSFVDPITRFPQDAGPFVAAEVPRFNVNEFIEDPAVGKLPRHTQFALVASRLALQDAKIDRTSVALLDPLVATGTSLMDSEVINKTIENVALKGPRFGLARVVFHGPVASVAAAVADQIGGVRTMSLQSACCSGIDAIGYASEVVSTGGADLALCGGAEAPIYFHPMLELRMAGMSPSTAERPDQLCRPFDLWRTTGVIGEGACMVVLEPEFSPRKGYAFVEGHSFATDPEGSIGPGLKKALELCLGNAQMRAEEIDMISCWGPGHREIDAMEARVLTEIFGDRILRMPAVSIKGAIGNPFAAAGAIQVGCASLGLMQGFVPPTVNWKRPDPFCNLGLSGSARFVDLNKVLVTAHGISGTNSGLILSKCD